MFLPRKNKTPWVKNDEEQPLLERRDEKSLDLDRPLSVISKICYGTGGIPFLIAVGVFSAYFPLFLLEVAMIRPSYASIVMFGGRTWEAIANPVVGVIVNKTDTHLGKKPWMICGLPFLVVSYFLVWIVTDWNEKLRFAYHLLMYCTCLTSLACYNVPYLSLIMYLSDDQQDRDGATLYRMVCSVIGAVLGNVIMSQFLARIDSIDSLSDPCGDWNQTVTQTVLPTIPPEARTPRELAFLTAAGTVVGVIALFGMVVILGTKEKKEVFIRNRGQDDKAWDNMKAVLSHRPYYIGLICFLFALLNFQMLASNMTLYLLYSLRIDSFYYGVIILQVSDAIFMPVWQKMSSKFGKKTTLRTGLLLLMPIAGSLYFLPENNVIVAFVFCHLVGVALSCIHLLPWSLIPDIIDDYTARTGERKDAIFYSFFQSFKNLFGGVGMGMSTFVLGLNGYETGACQQPYSVDFTMRILVSVIPICVTSVSLIFLCMFPITQARMKENKEILAQIRERRRLNSNSMGQKNKMDHSYSMPRMAHEGLED